MERNVPKLRFKGFNDEWKQKKLKDISTYVNRTIAENETIENVLTISAGKGFLNQKDRFSQVIAGNSLKKYTVLYNNEFSYNRGNSKKYTYGCIYKLENYEKALVPNVYISFKINNGVEDYYKQLFVKKYLDRQLRQLISSSARMDGLLNINKEDFFNVHVPVPSLEEQERIANFLTKVDKIMEKQDEKVKNLEKYKKGMMQKIFSQEIRFKDENGDEYPEWEEKKLKDVSDVRDGTHDSPVYVKKGYPLVTSKNLCANGKIDYNNVNYITKEDYDSINQRSKVNTGDILFGMIGTIGNPVIVDREDFAIKNVALIKENGKLLNRYLIYFLSSNKILKQFYMKNAGGTQKFIALNLIRDLSIDVPSVQEQIKISNYMFKIDLIIEKKNKKLEELKRWKKGLVQQMFV